MHFRVLFFLLFLALLCHTLAQGSYEDCCLRYAKTIGKKTTKMVVSYRRQDPDGGCNIPAIVFKLRRGKLFCADPRQMWVRDLINLVDSKSKAKQSKVTRKITQA